MMTPDDYSMGDEEERFRSQSGTFGERGRAASRLAVLGAIPELAPFTRCMAAGAAGMGMAELLLDSAGMEDPFAESWFLRGHGELVGTIYCGTRLALSQRPTPEDVLEFVDGAANGWAVHLADGSPAARDTMRSVARQAPDLPVLLVRHAPGSVLVIVAAADHAARLARDMRPCRAPAGWAEALLASGLVLQRIMLAASDEAARTTPGIVGSYASSLPQRVSRSGPSGGDPVETAWRAMDEATATSPSTENFAGLRASLVGAGGLGNFMWLGPVSEGVAQITACDDDRLEVANLNRQLFLSHWRVGGYKIDGLSQAMTSFRPGLVVAALRARLQGADEFLRHVENSDVFFVAPDNNRARVDAGAAWVQSTRRPPLLVGGSGPWGARAVVVSQQTACYACTQPADLAALDQRRSCAHVEEAVVGSNMVAAGLAGLEARIAVGSGSGEAKRPCNIHYNARQLGVNCLEPMATPRACIHVN